MVEDQLVLAALERARVEYLVTIRIRAREITGFRRVSHLSVVYADLAILLIVCFDQHPPHPRSHRRPSYSSTRDQPEPRRVRRRDAPAVATDGGQVAADPDENTDENERPDDCECWDNDAGRWCWPCFRDGFQTPNPEPASDQ